MARYPTPEEEQDLNVILSDLAESDRLRDQFAMAALTGLCGSPLAKNLHEVSEVSSLAYELADAMIEARGGK